MILQNQPPVFLTKAFLSVRTRKDCKRRLQHHSQRSHLDSLSSVTSELFLSGPLAAYRLKKPFHKCHAHLRLLLAVHDLASKNMDITARKKNKHWETHSVKNALRKNPVSVFYKKICGFFLFRAPAKYIRRNAFRREGGKKEVL